MFRFVLAIRSKDQFCGHEVALQCAKALLLSMPRGRQHRAVCHGRRPPFLQSTILPSRQGWARAISFAASRRQPAGCPAPICKPSEYRPPRKTVSSKIGYEDIGFFRNLFKRHTGMTPGEYRDKFSQMSLERGELISGSAVRRCTLSQGVRDLAAGKCLTASRAASSIVVNTAPSLRSRSTRSSSASIL
jgi:AraC-like DNA-binding protein